MVSRVNKKILGAVLAASLMFGAVAPAHAADTSSIAEFSSADEVKTDGSTGAADNSAGSSGSSESTEAGDSSSAEDAVLGALGVAAVVGVVVAGVNYAVAQGWIPNPMHLIFPPAPAPAPAPAPTPAPAPAPAPAPVRSVTPAPVQNTPMYKNCTDVWNRLGRPIRSNEAGFQSKLDADGDGVGCERDPR